VKLLPGPLRRAFAAIKKSASPPPVLTPADTGRGWISWWIGRPETDFQQDVKPTTDSILAYHAVFSCVTLIAADIGKLRVKLMQQDGFGGLWSETQNPAYSPVLRKPNHFQNHIQFKEFWIGSKLSRGNTYVLKERDNRGVVVALYVLAPDRVQPLVAPDSSVYYRLNLDYMSGIESDVVVPASEIIHDRMNCLFHPLVGISPLYASGLAAIQGLRIQNNSVAFFANGSKPGGVLTAPGSISDETAKRLKEYWDTNFTGANAGKVAVLGDNLKYEAMAATAVDSQLVEQLRWSAEVVCSTFHVPPFKIGIGNMPTFQNAEILNQIYYDDCLQSLIESMELCLDEGLGLGLTTGTELDLEGLMRMDTATQARVEGDLVKAGIKSPNESRARFDLKPVKGGDSPYLQQQNFSLEALAKRDALENPFVIDRPTSNPTPSADGSAATADPSQPAKEADWQRKSFEALALELAE
jgi:HK97 family phage portal protein